MDYQREFLIPHAGDTVSLDCDGGGTRVEGVFVTHMLVDEDEELLGIVAGDGDDRTSWVLLKAATLPVVGCYRKGDSDEFYDHDNLPFQGEVIEVDADGVLYVASQDLTRNVWVDPLTKRVTENSTYDYA